MLLARFRRVSLTVGFGASLFALVLSFFVSSEGQADNWVGGNSDIWNVVQPAVPGWDPAIPNGVGAIAQKIDGTSGTVTADIPVTLGSIIMGGSSAAAFGITPTAGVTLDQDGAGAGVALILNENTSGGTNPAVVLNAGTITLADDLLISNTSNSLRTTGAIIVNSTLTGFANVSFLNESNNYPVSATSFAGAIRLQTAANSFLGDVTFRKGLVSFNNGASFGDASNVLTVGTGEGSVSLLSTGGVVPNSIVVNSPDDGIGDPDVVVLGSAGAVIAGNMGYSGNITLNEPVILSGPTWSGINGNGTIFSGDITGNVDVTKQDGALPISVGVVTLAGTNTYTGVTHVKNGALQFATPHSFYNNQEGSFAGAWNPNNLIVEPGAIGSFYVGGDGEFTVAQVQSLMSMSTASGMFKSGAGVGFNTENYVGGNLIYSDPLVDLNGGANITGYGKFGGNTMTLTAANTYTGATYVNGGILQFANRESLYNADTSKWTAANLNVGAGGTAAFNVGGVGEFTLAEVENFMTFGTATSGFMGVNAAVAGASNIGIDTTNTPGGLLAVSNNIVNPNGGQNPMGLTKLGTGTLELSGTNTYTGSTIVDEGTLRLVGGSHTVDPRTVADAQINVLNTVGNYNIGSTPTADGHLVIDGSNITSDNGIMVGQFGKGSMTLNSGTVILKNDNAGGEQFLGIGRFAGSEGTYVQNGGSLLVGSIGESDWFVVGRDGIATATLNDGEIKASTFALAQGGTGVGTFNINGGTVTTFNNMYVVNGEGTINQTGGDLRIGTWLTLGEAASAVAEYNISGGTMTTGNRAAENFVLGFLGEATVNQTGGDITVGLNYISGWNIGASGEHTMSDGTMTVLGVALVGNAGEGKWTQTGGTVTLPTPGRRFSVGEAVDGIGEFDMSGGSITVADDWFIFARFGQATGTLSGTGSITAGRVAMFSEFGSALSTFDMEGGTLAAANWFVGGQGISTFNQTGGAITTTSFSSLARSATGIGTWNMSGGSFANTADLNIGDNGQGTLNMSDGEINTGQLVVAYNATASGTATHTGGEINTVGWAIVGNNGIGIYNLDGGELNVGDNFVIGSAIFGDGTVNITSGTVTVRGELPNYTGNVVVGSAGVGTLNMMGGLLDMVATDIPDGIDSLNSLSHSIVNSGVANVYDLAQDGNFVVGETEGIGAANVSGGTINVAANVLVGSVNTQDSAYDGFGQGTLTITGGVINVGVTSPTGGDVVLGGTGVSGFAVGNILLQGGTLNATNGSGKIGSAGGTTSFSFTGGTLKVKEYNAGDFGGNLGMLVQNGAGSLLDATGNNTQLNGGYDLGEGTATIGTGRTLSTANVLNSFGAGVINVGTGGSGVLEGDYNLDGAVNAADYPIWRDFLGNPPAYTTWKNNFGGSGGGGPAHLDVGGGTVDVDTLNFDNGEVTASLATVRTALNGGGSFSNDLVLDAGNTLTLEINGSTPVTDYDVLDVTGMLTAGGVLDVTVGFTPTANEMFDILDFGSIVGSFSSVNFSTGVWDDSALLTTGIVTYLSAGAGAGANVPEPATWSLMAIALAGLLGTRSMRNRRK